MDPTSAALHRRAVSAEMVTARKKSPCELMLVFWYKRHMLITWYDTLILPPLPVWGIKFTSVNAHLIGSSSQNFQPNHISLTHTPSFNYLSFIISTSVESHSFFSVHSLIPAPRARRACNGPNFLRGPFLHSPFFYGTKKS